MTPTDIKTEPLAVWDANDRYGLFWDRWRETHKWALAHLADANSTYRVEFYDADPPFAVTYRFALNEDGRKFRLDETGEPAFAEPVIEALDELPPAHLLGR